MVNFRVMSKIGDALPRNWQRFERYVISFHNKYWTLEDQCLVNFAVLSLTYSAIIFPDRFRGIADSRLIVPSRDNCLFLLFPFE